MSIGTFVKKVLTKKIFSKCIKCVSLAFDSRYLLFTNVALSVSLSGIGDIMQQNYEIVTKKIDKWDKQRTRTMAISGGSLGVVCHFWYYFLDKYLPGYTIKIVIKKIIVDQFVGSPLSISTFFLTCAYLEGTSYQDCLEEIKQKAWRLYMAEWIIWPPAQFINFYFLSTKHRVLFDNTISLGYDVYTSKVKHD